MIKPYLSQHLPQKLRANSFSLSFKILVSTIIFLFLMLPAAWAQQKPGYNLLWRISGKGLSKPSYLFGTMHVKDKRAFAFSDSVMLAIKNCQAFALEVHPDTMIKKMFETILEKDSSRSIRKLLSKDDYAKLAKRFEEKNGYPMGNIDPVQAESLMQAEKKKPDDRKTFVDAYLYGVARAMNKSIYGLENTSQQFEAHFGTKSDLKSKLEDIIDDNDEAELNSTEQMIKIYSKGNIYDMFSYLGEDYVNDDDLIARNKVMVNSMLTHMPNETLFTAVGVAHLPGDNGIIAQLRKAGYTLTPVTANFTGIAGKYNTDYSKLKWQNFIDEDKGFSLEFPFKPMQTELLYGFRTIIYPDIPNDIFFGAYAIKKGTNAKPASAQAIINGMLSNFKKSKKNQIISNTPIVVNGLKYNEVIMKTHTEVIRMRFTVANNYLYCIYAGNNESDIRSAYANRYFASFKSFKPASKPNPGWITFKNDTAAFTVHLPFQPKLIEKKVPDPKIPNCEPYDIKMYMAADTVNLENYLIRYNDYPKGVYLAYKNQVLDALTSEFKTRGTLLGAPRKITVDGYEGREADILITKTHCRVRLFTRGNRIYLLMKQNLAEGATAPETNDDFFESFKLTPYLSITQRDFDINGGNFKAKMLGDTKTLIDSVSYRTFLKGAVTNYATNPVSGGVYCIEHSTISSYYRAPNTDSVYNDIIKKMVTYQDSLIKSDTVVVNGFRGREFVKVITSTGDKTRVRLFIDNGDVILFTGHMANEELFNEASNVFYNSLQKIHDTKPIDLTTSKAGKIVNDLSSADTTTYNYAKGALYYYKFNKDELPYVYQALQVSHPDDSAAYGARSKLINILEDIHDEKSVDVLIALYNKPGTNDQLKANILEIIYKIDAKTGYDAYLNLITSENTIKTEEKYRLFSGMRDSLDFVAANFNWIIPLLKNPEYRYNILSVLYSMTYGKSSDKYTGVIKNNFTQIMQFAQTDLAQYISETDTAANSIATSIFYYLKLMEKIKGQPITANFTAKLIKQNKINGELPVAVTTRIANHLPVDEKLTNRLLDSIDQRYDIMEAFNNENQLQRVPLKYKKQDEFARLSLYQYIIGDDEQQPKHITLLGSLPDNGKLYYVFKYTSSYDDDNTQYLGVNGSFVPGSVKLDFKNNHSFAEEIVKGETWQKQAKKMITILKKSKD